MAHATQKIGNATGRAKMIEREVETSKIDSLCDRILADIDIRKDIERTKKIVSENLGRQIAEKKDRRAVEASAIEAINEWL